MSTTALTTAGRSLVRRKRPNRPSVDNAFASSWCPHYGIRFTLRGCETPADIYMTLWPARHTRMNRAGHELARSNIDIRAVHRLKTGFRNGLFAVGLADNVN